MSDLIRRQAVIDALEESGYCYHFWIDIENIINALPSEETSTNTSTDLISRQDAIDSWDKLSKRGRTEFDQVLMTLPSAPDSRQRGEWVDNHNGTFVCDQCGCKHSKSNFCPNCGARMKGGAE